MSLFQAGGKAFPLNRTYVMGILNVTPDSFSDGGCFLAPEAAVSRGLEMEALGADFIDIGGQSTRPGYTPISPQEEWERIREVVPAVVKATGLAVSVDTFYPQVARLALEAGAHIINDVSGFGDEMLETVKAFSCGCIIMHPRGSERDDILREEHDFFLERMEAAERRGISRERLCFDPGIGFGKTYEENLRLLACPQAVKIPGVALLMAASRKRVIGEAVGNPPFGERMPGTIAAHTASILQGADFIRVHDVQEAVQAARMADAMKGVL